MACRSEFAAVYDEVGRRMIVYGGSTAVSMGCNIATPIFVEDVYAYDDMCGNWRRISATGPGPRARMMATYDSVARRVIAGRKTEYGCVRPWPVGAS